MLLSRLKSDSIFAPSRITLKLSSRGGALRVIFFFQFLMRCCNGKILFFKENPPEILIFYDSVLNYRNYDRNSNAKLEKSQSTEINSETSSEQLLMWRNWFDSLEAFCGSAAKMSHLTQNQYLRPAELLLSSPRAEELYELFFSIY